MPSHEIIHITPNTISIKDNRLVKSKEQYNKREYFLIHSIFHSSRAPSYSCQIDTDLQLSSYVHMTATHIKNRTKKITTSNRRLASIRGSSFLLAIVINILAMQVCAQGNFPTRNQKLMANLKPHGSMNASKMELGKNVRGGGTDRKSNGTKQDNEASGASAIRNALFPIYGKEEVTKFFLIGSIKFFVILALTLTRDNKDTMVVTACGAEAIAFLKIYGVLPAATLFIALYSKMATLLEKKTLFYATCIPFFAFFFIFDAIIYPNRDSIQPSLSTVHSMLGMQPDATGASVIFAKLFANWTSALFYVVAEVYSSVSVGILFWQFANDVVTVQQAKRFYPLFAQMSGLAPILAGQYVVRYASQASDFGESLHRLTRMVTFAGVMICLFYKRANDFLESNNAIKSDVQVKKKKAKMTMAESTRFLASSEYLRLIAALVLGYGLSINFTDIMWKSILKKKYPDPLDYQRFMGNFSSVVGLSTCIVIFFGVHAIRILGWRTGALATPGVMACLAVPYFTSILMGVDQPKALYIAVALGTIQTLLSKTAKYALFDPTTQMAYIPLDDESKVKGKAAIEVLGSRIGKSGGSLIQQGLVMIFGDIISAAPALAVIYYCVLVWWAYSAHRLGILFTAKTEEIKSHRN